MLGAMLMEVRGLLTREDLHSVPYYATIAAAERKAARKPFRRSVAVVRSESHGVGYEGVYPSTKCHRSRSGRSMSLRILS